MRTGLSALAVLAMLGFLVAGAARAVTITCDAVTRDMCSEYDVPTEREAVGIWKTCGKMGASPRQGTRCNPAPSCRQSRGDGSVTTYVYDKPGEEVQQDCARNGGRYDGG